MEMYVVEGGRALRGTVRVSGSKNACLPLMCAAMLADSPTIIENVPDLRDIRSMKYLLEHLNGLVTFDKNRLIIDPGSFDTDWVPYDVMRKMRASMYAFGPMIARRGKAAVSKPGGCNIGSRPIDLHLRGFRALGVDMVERKGYIHAHHNGLKGAEMSLMGGNGTSVGATCNVLMAAALAEGRTIINDAAIEPECVELASFLNSMGAQITGIGTNTLTIDGVKQLYGTNWRVAPDRIEAGTFAIAAIITDGDLLLEDVSVRDMGSTLAELIQWGAEVTYPTETSIRVRRSEGQRGHALHLTTAPYPALPTDIQPAFMAMLGLTPGTSTVTETIYADRFMIVDELNRLGANIHRDGARAAIYGVDKYEGAAVMSSDLRAGAALVLAALAAEGESQIRRIYHVERGYERFEQKLAAVGAKIVKQKEEETDPGLIALAAEIEEEEAPAEAR